MRRFVLRTAAIFGLLSVCLFATSAGSRPETAGAPALAAGTTEVIVHYHRIAGDYAGWNLWLWPHQPDSRAGAAYQFTAGDSFGKVADALVPGDNTEVGIIVRLREWQAKDVEEDRFIQTPAQHAEVWLIQGDPTIYHSESAALVAVAEAARPRVLSSYLDGAASLLVKLSLPVASSDGFTVVDATNGSPIPIVSAVNARTGAPMSAPADLITLTLASAPDVTHTLTVAYQNRSPVTIIPRRVLDDPRYFYAGNDLGARYGPRATAFRLWAPTASAVGLVVYRNENGDVLAHLAMQRDRGGTWYARVVGNLRNMFYVYEVTNRGSTQSAVDPYANGISVNGNWGMIVDLKGTDPRSWSSDHYRRTSHPEDAVIYEVHVRDFSIDRSSGMKHRGKFLAFTERGTRGPGGVKTGVDSLTELGITHVELLPAFHFASIDENRAAYQYNWGYDPQDFNVPEGAYATTPHGTARITEFKQMVQALHRRHLAVIMDVVYNHTFTTGSSNFDKIVPRYYYRTNDAGMYTNGSGVGNEVAAERPMVRKFVLDSVRYWMRQYHVDGYRFDEMALLGKPTMTAVSKELHRINPSTVLLGEPWGGSRSGLVNDQLLTKGAQKNLHVAVFNDLIRDGLAGSAGDRSSRGYATGDPSAFSDDTALAEALIAGSIDYSPVVKGFTALPDETINYVECHDNMTLWDRIASSNPSLAESKRIDMDELAQAAVMTSQGIPFMAGGMEFLRSKQGNDNSYNAGDLINQFYWGRKLKYARVFKYYQGLMLLRRLHPAFRMSRPADIRSHLRFLSAPVNTTVFQLTSHANGDRWNNITVIWNPDNTAVSVPLPGGRWNVVGTRGRVGVATIGHASTAVRVPANSAEVLQGGGVGKAVAPATTASGKSVSVTFRVHVPASTPPGDTVYIAGNIDQLGPWDPGRQAMTNAGGGLWTVTLSIPDGTRLQYKYTRGSWDKVESWGTIIGTANRHVTIAYGAEGLQAVDDTATDWGQGGADDHRAVQKWVDLP